LPLSSKRYKGKAELNLCKSLFWRYIAIKTIQNSLHGVCVRAERATNFSAPVQPPGRCNVSFLAACSISTGQEKTQRLNEKSANDSSANNTQRRRLRCSRLPAAPSCANRWTAW